LSTKIGRAISQICSAQLLHVDSRSGTKELWRTVNQLTKGAKKQSDIISLTDLNAFFASYSQDTNYIAPLHKQSTFSNTRPFIEQRIFFLGDHLKATATRSDQLPSWFLTVGAPFLRALFHIL